MQDTPPEPTRRQQVAELVRLEYERLLQGSIENDNGRAMLWLELFVGLVQLDEGAVSDIVRPTKAAPGHDGTRPRPPAPAFGLVREAVLHDCMRYVMNRENCGRDIALGIVAHDTGANTAEIKTAYNNREYRDGTERQTRAQVSGGRVVDERSYARACDLLSSGRLPGRTADGRRKGAA